MTNKFRDCQAVEVKEEFPVDIGDSFSFDVIAYTNPTDNVILDLTGADLTFTAKDDKLSPTVTVEKTIGDGITVINAPLGHARITLDPTDTAVLGEFGGILFFDVKLTDLDGNIFTLARGSLRLTPDVG